MGRQPFRQMKSDGTREEAGASSASSGSSPPLLHSEWGLGHSSFKYYEVNPHIAGKSSNRALSSAMGSGSTRFIPMYSYRGGTLDNIGIAIETATTSTGSMTLAIYDSYSTSDSGASLKGGYPKDFLGKVVLANMDTTGGTLLVSNTWLNHSGSSQTAPTLDADTWYWLAVYWTGTSRNVRQYQTNNNAWTQFQMPLVGTWGNGWPQIYHSGNAPSASYSTTHNWSGAGFSYIPVFRFSYA